MEHQYLAITMTTMRCTLKLLLLLCLFGCSHIEGSPVSKDVKPGSQDWWKHAVFYQIYPRSFKDSNNDGIGDIRGIISRLSHLVNLGVTAVWLSPIYPSPMADFGYDISDFRGVDPSFGTMQDFEDFVTIAHRLGLKVILDFVPNHSSDEHEWFQKALKNDPKYRDYYIWREGKNNGEDPPNNWISYFHGQAWTKPQGQSEWYLHQFHTGQPDLNYRNPQVQQEMKDVLTFWMDKGVDGFRVDTIPNLVETASFPDEALTGNEGCTDQDRCYLKDEHQSNQPETFEEVYAWRAHLDAYVAQHGGDARVMMTEAYVDLDLIKKYYGSAEDKLGAHFSFNFRFITHVSGQDDAGRITDVINQWVEALDSGKYTPNWVLGNHDQHRLASRYGLERADGMIMLQMLLPGVAVTYMGEEISMENGDVSFDEGQDPQGCNAPADKWIYNTRDFQRTPFQWDNSTNAGFNTGYATWLPVSEKYTECNVKAQDGAEKSPLQMYKSLIRMRTSKAVIDGDLAATAINNNKVVQVVRRSGDEHIMVLVMNVGGARETVDLKGLNLPSLLFVQAASRNSELVPGLVFDAQEIVLQEFEAVIIGF